jgi:hypothetical protein
MAIQTNGFSFTKFVDNTYQGAKAGITNTFQNVVAYIAASTVYMPTHSHRTSQIMRDEGWNLVSCGISDFDTSEDTVTIYRGPDGGLHNTSSTYYKAARSVAASDSRAEIKERIFGTSGKDLTPAAPSRG